MSEDAQSPFAGARPSVGGVVITYHPDAEFETRLAAMARQVATMLVVDNSATESVRPELASIAMRAGCRFIAHAHNLGIAAALNGALAELEHQGFDWAVAFDQDSTPEDGCVSALVRLAAECPRAAVVGSNWWDEARPAEPTRHLVHGSGFRPWFRRMSATHDIGDVTFVITSGSLIRLEAWRGVQGFSSELFLDLVDTEFCLRAARNGWSVHLAAGARLRHRRGQKRPARWCGHTWWPAQIPPRRIRLIVRNRVWMLWRYGWRRWPWATFELTHTAFMLFSALCLEEDKGPKLAAFFGGFSDAVRRRLGPPAWAKEPVTPTSVSASRTTPS